ncbi:hypothetical protein HMPREF9135_2221 [Segatella baroniae F0067]|uniref:Uncharacterized protein n=1 Tax=Segatella baroniae F0067 TaxID=1115809 RepID=U2NNT1_9BACT|nr:hypothetical protein [Segatella baroniae]ERK39725.1 hypothetical protein HMPREF9135_2221 [Segatella baroniae F0067]
MGIRYTKKNDENENKEKTVQAEEFINLMISTKRNAREVKELPKTEVGK